MGNVLEGAVRAPLVGVVGREVELGVLGGFVEAGGSRRALVLTGEPGIGKTTLWESGVALARQRGLRVLVARPSSAQARSAFAGLIDLFDGVPVDALGGIPPPQRSALEIALLRAEPAAVAPEPQVIALGVLNALRTLGDGEPFMVAVDDLQWLDPPSADALVFALRRLEHVAFLLARRAGRALPMERVLESWRLERLDVGPLSFSASRRLLADRFGLVLSRQVLRRILAVTLGNPLFVLEVGRALLEQGVPRLGDDIPIPGGVDDLLAKRVGRLSAAPRRVLLAVALSGELHAAELAAVVGAPVVDDSVDSGLLVMDSGRVRASHPLLAAVAMKRSRLQERRELHRGLAAAVGDGELRALHMALATTQPDAELSALLATGAAHASARGARQQAVLLAEHALRLTPADAAERGERLLELANHLQAAGELERLAGLLVPQVHTIPAGVLRARAWLMLNDTVDTAAEYHHHVDLALGESQGDRGLRARVLSVKAMHASATEVSQLAEAEAWGHEALDCAQGQEAEVKRMALYALAWARAMRGQPIEELCERFSDASAAAFYIVFSPQRVAGQRHVWRGELNEARTEIKRLLALADERGELSSYAMARLHLCELELRAGEWDAASRLLDEWAESAEAELLDHPMYERCRALLAAGRGLAEETTEWSARAVERADASSSRWDVLEALRARGVTALREQDPGLAVGSLGAVWEHTCREGVDEPGVFPVAPELVEALAERGQLDEACHVIARLRDLSEQQHHPWGLVTTRRCEAIVKLSERTYDEQAARTLAGAAEDYGRLGLRFDRARCLLTLGRAQRRMKKWGPARASLQGAIAAFEELGSVGWAKRARDELARTGGRRPRSSGELTATEREVVELAASGRANKEIAQALSLAVHTVEVHLSRAYAKLGVRSRSQLAGRLSSRLGTPRRSSICEVSVIEREPHRA